MKSVFAFVISISLFCSLVSADQFVSNATVYSNQKKNFLSGELNSENLEQINRFAHELVPYDSSAFSSNPLESSQQMINILKTNLRDNSFQQNFLNLKDQLAKFLVSGGVSFNLLSAGSAPVINLSAFDKIPNLHPLIPIILRGLVYEHSVIAFSEFSTLTGAGLKNAGLAGLGLLLGPVGWVGTAFFAMANHKSDKREIYGKQQALLEKIMSCTKLTLDSKSPEIPTTCEEAKITSLISSFRIIVASVLLYNVVMDLQNTRSAPDFYLTNVAYQNQITTVLPLNGIFKMRDEIFEQVGEIAAYMIEWPFHIIYDDLRTPTYQKAKDSSLVHGSTNDNYELQNGPG